MYALHCYLVRILLVIVTNRGNRYEGNVQRRGKDAVAAVRSPPWLAVGTIFR